MHRKYFQTTLAWRVLAVFVSTRILMHRFGDIHYGVAQQKQVIESLSFSTEKEEEETYPF
jgi:hypothetical protein